MKRTPKLTRRERQEKTGKGPAQAHFPSGRSCFYVSPEKVVKRDPPAQASPGVVALPAGCCPSPKFKTVSKKDKKYVCRRCGTPKSA